MIHKQILDFTSSFKAQFGEYLNKPDLSHFDQRDLNRMEIENAAIVLPAETRFSDWDVYCYADTEKITVDIIGKMRDFILGWKGFNLMRDYVTSDVRHKNVRAFQSIGIGKIYYVQFMGVIAQETFAPFVDFHIGGIDPDMMEEFYQGLDQSVSQGYSDWSVLTFWRKIRRTGAVHTDNTIVQRSILPVLQEELAKMAVEKPFEFFKIYFKDRTEFTEVCQLLASE